MLVPTVSSYAESNVAEHDAEAADDCNEGQGLSPSTPALTPATGTLEYTDAGGEIAILRNEVVVGNRRSCRDGNGGGHGVITRWLDGGDRTIETDRDQEVEGEM